MGDRSSASYRIPLWAEKLVNINNEQFYNYGYNTGLICEYDELSGGTDDALESYLHALCIPYDHDWGSGDEYSEGYEQVRWGEEGDMIHTSFDDKTNDMINIDIALSILNDNDIETAKQLIEGSRKVYKDDLEQQQPNHFFILKGMLNSKSDMLKYYTQNHPENFIEYIEETIKQNSFTDKQLEQLASSENILLRKPFENMYLMNITSDIKQTKNKVKL